MVIIVDSNGAAWPIIGSDITKAIEMFFDSGRMLKAWTMTKITLIPKSTDANTPCDVRPILCCHVL